MSIKTDGNGLRLAIEDALKQMDAEGADGVEYVIGKVRGMPVRIVIEPENDGVIDAIVVDGPLTYTAVMDDGS